MCICIGKNLTSSSHLGPSPGVLQSVYAAHPAQAWAPAMVYCRALLRMEVA